MLAGGDVCSTKMHTLNGSSAGLPALMLVEVMTRVTQKYIHQVVAVQCKR
jgi:hypothetical protein